MIFLLTFYGLLVNLLMKIFQHLTCLWKQTLASHLQGIFYDLYWKRQKKPIKRIESRTDNGEWCKILSLQPAIGQEINFSYRDWSTHQTPSWLARRPLKCISSLRWLVRSNKTSFFHRDSNEKTLLNEIEDDQCLQ